MKRSMTALGQQRDRLGLDQHQMAALLKVSQPEVSRTENGELPPNKKELSRWARAYRVSVRRFVQMCLAMVWELELWKYSECKTPAEIQHIDCRIQEVKSA